MLPSLIVYVSYMWVCFSISEESCHDELTLMSNQVQSYEGQHVFLRFYPERHSQICLCKSGDSEGAFSMKGDTMFINCNLWPWVEHHWKKFHPSLPNILDGSKLVRFHSSVSVVKSEGS
ncbi:hypothetical protein AMECASPLE_034247 [Ameca splendens]|uniref:Uncharacterized protein n=1 Tax=Ameca splendens TaxID=208324 RepID=A0ABV0ZRX7_9TELE